MLHLRTLESNSTEQKIRFIIRNILVLTVMTALGLQTNFQLFYYVLFSVNQAELTEEVCEAVKPECNACCYLEKKMDEGNESESLPARDDRSKKGYELKVQEYSVSESDSEVTSVTGSGLFLQDHTSYLNNFHTDIFHPPRIAFLI